MGFSLVVVMSPRRCGASLMSAAAAGCSRCAAP